MHASASPSTARGTPSRRGKSPRFTSNSPSQADSSTLPSNFPNKPINTFASSLDIPVEGATAIESDSEKDIEPAEPEQATTNDSKRAPRKSKTEALAALDSHTKTLSPDRDFQQEITAKYRHVPPIPVSPTLDLSTVKTASPRHNAITHKAPRPFGLQNCPEYYPTMEQFKDPMEYIRSISDQAQQYGICKVIPPTEWTMPFVADTQVRDNISTLKVSSINDPNGRLSVSEHDFNVSTPSKRLLELNSIFWSNFTNFISNKAIHVSLYPQLTTSR